MGTLLLPLAGERAFHLNRSLVFFLAILLFPALAAAQSGRDPEKLQGKERSDVERWIRQFKSEKDADRRDELSDMILDLGPPAAGRFLESIRSDLSASAGKYRQALARAAEKSLRKRVGKKEKKEIDDLRTAVTALRRKKGLTSGDIAAVADPALQRLRELLLPPPMAAVEGSEQLIKTRDRIEELIRYEEECLMALGREIPTDGGRLDKIESRAMAIPLFDASRQTKVFEANEEAAATIDPAEAEGIFDLNRLRLLLGLRALRTDAKLCDAARDHSSDMRTKNFFAHKSPVPGKAAPWDRARNFGTSASAENIYAGSSDPIDANVSWYYSPGHHKNMLNPRFQVVGLGCSKKHWTMMFR